MAVNRDQLYEEVWAEPMTKVAERYKVSSSFLARVCERLKVPRPARGYWMQLEVGRATERPPLPEALAGDEFEWLRNGEGPRIRRPRPRGLNAQPRRVKARKVRPAVHGLIVGAGEHFDAAKVTETGYLRPSKHILVDVYVAQDTLKRALDLANEVFLAFEDRGHQVTIPSKDAHYSRPEVDERLEGGRERYQGAWGPKRPTVVFIGTVPIGLSLYELSEKAEVERVDGKYVRARPRKPDPRNPYSWVNKEDMPTGRLCLRATSGYWHGTWERKWQESKPGDLAGRTPQILKEIEQEIPAIVKLIEEGERQAELERQRWEIQHKKWKREEEEKIRAQNLKESREELFSIIEAWALAKRIETFFEDAGQRAEGLPEEESKTMLDRLNRARELLGGVDALKRFLEWRSPEERHWNVEAYLADLAAFKSLACIGVSPPPFPWNAFASPRFFTSRVQR